MVNWWLMMVISGEWLLMWVKQCQKNHPWLGMLRIQPIKMVMTGGWLIIVFMMTTYRCNLNQNGTPFIYSHFGLRLGEKEL